MYSESILNELTEIGILQSPTLTQDNTGAPVMMWNDVARIWFRCKPPSIRGIEKLIALKEIAVQLYDVVIRTPPSDIVVTPSWRIIWTTNNDAILTILAVTKLNTNFLKLECELVSA